MTAERKIIINYQTGNCILEKCLKNNTWKVGISKYVLNRQWSPDCVKMKLVRCIIRDDRFVNEIT